jgi:NTE family protein
VERKIDYFKYGLHYNSDLKTTILLNATIYNKFGKRSRFSSDIYFGENIGFRFSYYNPLAWKYGLGLLITIEMENFEIPFYDSDTRLIESLYNFYRFSAGIDLLTNFSNAYSIGSGLKIENLLYDPVVSNDRINGISDINYRSIYGFIKYDTFDKTIFPTKGLNVELRAELIPEYSTSAGKPRNDPIKKVTTKIHSIIPVTKTLSISNHFQANILGASPDIMPFKYFAGGSNSTSFNTIPFNGIKFMEIPANNIFSYSVVVRYEFFPHHYVSFEYDLGNVSNNYNDLFSFKNEFAGYAVGYSIDTQIGPIEFRLSIKDGDSQIIPSLNLGYVF